MVQSKSIQSFRDLVVWQKAFALCVEVYRVTEAFPKHERYGLTADLRKTARSLPYNIAEGHRRTSSTREYVRFLDIASGSAAELQTQFLLGRALGYTDEKGPNELLFALAEVERMLTALMHKLRAKAPARYPDLP